MISNSVNANATNFNAAFISRTVDTSTIGKLDLINPNAESGGLIHNIQRELNGLAYFTGRTIESAFATDPAWVNNDVGSSTDNLFDRADALTERFNATTGHTHDGVDSPKVDSGDIASTRLKGTFIRSNDYTGLSVSSLNVSFDMSGKTPSTTITTKGVVVNAPNNLVLIRDATPATVGDLVKSPVGDIVYGRLTESSGVWTLSFYTNVAGTETAYTLVSQSFQWYYQELFNPIVDAPVYSDLVFVPSDNATQDVVDASATSRGVVSTGTQTFAGAKTFSGGVIATVTGTASGNTTITPNQYGVVLSGAANALVVIPPDSSSTKFLRSNGLAANPSWEDMAGGGGGGSLQWIEDLDAPLAQNKFFDKVYSYQDGIDQALYALIKVPSGYTSGNQIIMKALWYVEGTATCTGLMSTQSTLIRPVTDPVSSTTNQHTSTNSAVSLSAGTDSEPQAVDMDLTDGSGQINGVAVSPGDLIRVKLFRDTATDTAAADIDVLVYATEVTFS